MTHIKIKNPELGFLSRYYCCAKENNLDIIVRVTSDCPLINGLLIHEGIEHYLSVDPSLKTYLSVRSGKDFPRGLDFEIFSFALLEEAHLHCLELRYREHVTPYMQQHTERKQINIIHLQDKDRSIANWRLCIDTREDYHLMQTLSEGFNFLNYHYNDLVEYLTDHPQLKAINQHILQKKV